MLGEHWIVRCSMEESDGEESVVRLQLVVLLGAGSTPPQKGQGPGQNCKLKLTSEYGSGVEHSVLLLLRHTD